MKIGFIATLIASIAVAADQKHPVRQEIVDDIKLKATSWQPREVHENHLRHVPVQNLHGIMGSLGNTPLSHTIEVGRQAMKFTAD